MSGQVDVLKARQPGQQQINGESAGNGDGHAAAVAFAEARLADNIGQVHRAQPEDFGPDRLKYQQRGDDNPGPRADDQKAQDPLQRAGHNIRQRFLLQHQAEQYNQAN